MARLRRIAKWTGVAATVLIGATDALSQRWCVHRFDSRGGVTALHRGGIGRDWLDPAYSRSGYWPPGWRIEPAYRGYLWWPSWSANSVGRELWVPIWIPLALAAAPTAILFHRDRRRHPRNLPGHCRTCGYNLAGLSPDGPCPECGTPRP